MQTAQNRHPLWRNRQDHHLPNNGDYFSIKRLLKNGRYATIKGHGALERKRLATLRQEYMHTAFQKELSRKLSRRLRIGTKNLCD